MQLLSSLSPSLSAFKLLIESVRHSGSSLLGKGKRDVLCKLCIHKTVFKSSCR